MSAGPSKELWLTDPERARELERQAQLQNAATPGGAPGAGDPRQLSLLTTASSPCRVCQLFPEQTGRPVYRHGCCGKWACGVCHEMEGC